MIEIERTRFLLIRFGDNARGASYVRAARCGVFCDMSGLPLDQEMADSLHRGRMAEFADMPPKGVA